MKLLGKIIRGMGQKPDDFLTIPLHVDYHVGRFGIDYGYGVQSWERDFGSQLGHLLKISSHFDYDIFEAAGFPQGTIDDVKKIVEEIEGA